MQVETTLAARIRAKRKWEGLTQERLAHRLNVAFSTVNGWEGGTMPDPNRHSTDRLMAWLGDSEEVKP